MILYRPVGTKELQLIAESNYCKFPPRLPEQPIFYPVLTEQYAVEIASRWNVTYNDDHKGYADNLKSIRWVTITIRNYGFRQKD